MLRALAFIGASAILLATALPAPAQTDTKPAAAKPATAKTNAAKKTGARSSNTKQRQATCNFGAKEQKLTGAKRKAYMKRCMANEDSPRGPAPGAAPAPAAAPKQ